MIDDDANDLEAHKSMVAAREDRVMSKNFVDDLSAIQGVCQHEPDFASIVHSDQAVGDMTKECILDVNCRHCGLSGTFRVDLTTEIDFDG